MKQNIILLITLIIAASSFAEARVWTDKKGNSLEAEYVHGNAAQVVLRDKKGKIYKFHPSKLSKQDQEYLATAFPPEMEITFKKRSDNKKHAYFDEKTTTMSGDVIISKKGNRPYSKSMKAVLMMIAESETENDFILVDRVESSFSFKNSKEFTLKGNTFKMFVDKDVEYGVKYTTYLVVILDDSGKVLMVKSGKKDFQEKAGLMLDLKKNDRFTKACRKTGTSSGGVHRR